ncbi:MAG: transcription termination factor Rho [Alphaproteobacteria bacterium]|nr:transcription termination factor Rho [Alphaproteobacteria bacterium]MCB9698528.1 transcription termination factor Rho [Alphaproteobacteria bacterium]
MPVDFPALHETTSAELRDKARALNIEGAEGMRRQDLVFQIGRRVGEQEGSAFGRGVLEVHAEGFGFLRSPQDNFLPGQDDIYVSQSQIRRFKLQTGDTVIGLVRPPKEGERYLALLRVESVNGEAPGQEPPSFDTLTAIYPDDRLPLARHPLLRVVDLAAPMGLGQRGLLVAPGRTGRVELLRSMAELMTEDEDLFVTVLLVGERPEEIHEWRTSSRAEIVATPFDEPPARHVQVADIVFERARRMVERGDDAVLLVDSLTRLLRFCLAELPPSGRTVGGVDTAALHRIRRYLGAARALEEGGSLTVIGAVSGDLDHEMDRVLLDDLRDVVNWELTLSREVADRGIRPPIDLRRTGTRREERLLADEEMERRRTFRSTLTGDLVEDAAKLVAEANGSPVAPVAAAPAPRAKAKAK